MGCNISTIENGSNLYFRSIGELSGETKHNGQEDRKYTKGHITQQTRPVCCPSKLLLFVDNCVIGLKSDDDVAVFPCMAARHFRRD
jgi:hypothetical protein